MGMIGALLSVPRPGGAADRRASAVQGLTVTEVEPISITGHSSVLNVALVVRGADSKSAQSDAEAALGKLRQSLRTVGIPTSAVKVMGYRVGSMPQAPGAKDTGAGQYFVVQNVEVRLTSAEHISQAVDAAVSSGAQMVQGGNDLMVLPTTAERQQAVAKAIQAARSDAVALAAGLGMKLGRVTGVVAQICRGASATQPYTMRVSVTFGG